MGAGNSLRYALAILIAASAAAPAAGAEEDISELQSLLAVPVYAASKYQQSVADAPAAVTILTQGEIRAFGWRTLAEILNAVRGVHTRYDRGYAYVGVRGLGRPGDYSSRLLLLVDGTRLNDNIYDSVFAGREFSLDVDLIERVEFIPGPGSAVHGSNAVLGTINLVTRSAASLRGRQVAASLDTQAGWKLNASNTQEFFAGSLLAAVSVEQRPGETLEFPEFDSPATPGGIARGMDAESAVRGYLRFEKDSFSWSALASRRSKGIPNAPYGLVFGDPAAEWVDSVALVGLNWHPAKIDGEGWYAQTGIGRYAYGDYGRYEPDSRLIRYENLGLWWHGELNRTQRIGSSQMLLFGVDVQRDLMQRLQMRLLDPVEPVAEIKTDGTRAGFYVSDDVTLGRHWQLGVGMRLDRNVTGKWDTAPRASLLWHPREQLVIKALLGSAYREPNIYERVPADYDSAWTENLRREHVAAKELVVDWTAGRHLRLSGSLYRNDVSHMIEQIVDPDTELLVYANVSSARAQGAELEAEYLGSTGVRVRASVARQDTTDDADQLLSNSPHWLYKLHATAPVPAMPLRAALELQGISSRLTETSASLPSTLLTNLTLTWNSPRQAWSASFSIHNLFDERIFDPTSRAFVGDRVEQDGREATLRVYVAF